jgi:hypothetical protein
MELKTDIEIQAPAHRVWEILMDFEAYPDWNPFIRTIAGKPDEGERLRVVLHPPESKPSTFTPQVLVSRSPNYAPPFQFRWKGSLPIPGLFTGEHYFVLEPKGENSVHLIHGEVFSGVLVPMLWKNLISTKTRQGFGEMNLALKERAERQAERQKN